MAICWFDADFVPMRAWLHRDRFELILAENENGPICPYESNFEMCVFEPETRFVPMSL